MVKLTAVQLLQVCPKMGDTRAGIIAALINEISPKYKIDTADRLHEFVATLAHESNQFAAKEENLNYRAARLLQVFPKYFNADSAAKCERNPVAIANVIYANRMGNGNAASNEGYIYRGGGFIQLTGKDMYLKYARYIGKEVTIAADLVRSTDRYALDSACWVFAVEKQLLDEADADDFMTVTKRINGGTIGMEERIRYYNLAKAAIV